MWRRYVPLALALTGCGTAVVDGMTVMKDDYDHAREQILSKATTDLACPREKLATKVLAVDVHADVTRVAVTGCGKDVVYARDNDAFAIEKAPPRPE